jgi:hypothetical protein
MKKEKENTEKKTKKEGVAGPPPVADAGGAWPPPQATPRRSRGGLKAQAIGCGCELPISFFLFFIFKKISLFIYFLINLYFFI